MLRLAIVRDLDFFADFSDDGHFLLPELVHEASVDIGSWPFHLVSVVV